MFVYCFVFSIKCFSNTLKKHLLLQFLSQRNMCYEYPCRWRNSQQRNDLNEWKLCQYNSDQNEEKKCEWKKATEQNKEIHIVFNATAVTCASVHNRMSQNRIDRKLNCFHMKKRENWNSLTWKPHERFHICWNWVFLNGYFPY